MRQSVNKERVQKILARIGIGSRRQIDQMLQDGRISVNGKKAEPGAKISTSDRVQIDGRLIKFSVKKETPLQVILYNKPVGKICTRKDPQNRSTIFDRLPKVKSGRWVSVGRLDINTSGLILLTTAGELANKLMHPSAEMEREYLVRVFGEVTREKTENMLRGVKLDDGYASFSSIRKHGGEGVNHWYRVILKEGRHHIVRKLWSSQDVQVNRLKRIRFGIVSLPQGLRSDQWVDLDKSEISSLMNSVNIGQLKHYS